MLHYVCNVWLQQECVGMQKQNELNTCNSNDLVEDDRILNGNQ